VIHADWGNSTLELHDDGTFVEKAVLKSGQERRIEGKWEYDTPFLSRQPCLVIDHDGVREKNGDACTSGVDGYFTDATEISVSMADAIVYRKEVR